MPKQRHHWLPHGVGCRLSAEEYQLLDSIRNELHYTVRDILLLGLRRARKILAIERRRQRRNGQ
jgi:hypothetical protein